MGSLDCNPRRMLKHSLDFLELCLQGYETEDWSVQNVHQHTDRACSSRWAACPVENRNISCIFKEKCEKKEENKVGLWIPTGKFVENRVQFHCLKGGRWWATSQQCVPSWSSTFRTVVQSYHVFYVGMLKHWLTGGNHMGDSGDTAPPT